MSAGWTAFVALLVALNVLGCVWLLWWTSRKRGDSTQESATTGHSWDEDLTEYNKPLPRWWLNLFYLTIVFAIAYLVVYPGLGSWKGTNGWTSNGELERESAAADALTRASYARFDALSLAELARHSAALELGAPLFATHCAACHGSDARGAKGFPNLTDDDWLWGGAPERVLETVLEGRRGLMPALGEALGKDGVLETAVYVQQLSGGPVDPTLAHRGKQRFDGLCAGCHGVDGKGNRELGAPDLTDPVWLYGGDFDSISETIRAGRSGTMPPHADLLGRERARLVSAWVLSRSAARDEAGAGR